MILLRMVFSFLIPSASGVLLTMLLLPRAGRETAVPLFRLFVGSGLGLGLSSCLHFLCLLADAPRAVWVVDLLVCLGLGLAVRLLRRGKNAEGQAPTSQGPAPWLDRLIAPLFGVGLLSSLISFVLITLREPHGRWDAWLIWTMHARFLYRGGDAWRDAFASGLDWSHWDYPLLLPLTIARGWTYAGQEEALMPAAVALVFTFLTLGLLTSALWVFRHRVQGGLAGLLLMGTPFFIAMGASQFADVPLAFFMLTAMALLVWQSRSVADRPGALALAGLAAAFAAWTKNEGLLFVLATGSSFTLITAYREGWKPVLPRLVPLLAGLLPVLMIVLFFKWRLAPANDLLAGLDPASLSAKLLDGSRYLKVLWSFLITGLSFTQGIFDVRAGMALNLGAVNVLLPLAYLGLAGIRRDPGDRAGFAQVLAGLVLMLAGYFTVYLLTPLDLDYHLMTSLNRLFLQLWPCFLLAVFLIAGRDPKPLNMTMKQNSDPDRKAGRGGGKRRG